ncbi:MAG TPA: PAS domain-containing sensor histidine kinase, partial [Candidatus Binatia bacterium]|nr:PAS domain-containing sensor histidine kinase [Candidatus Binatia bacterium]
MNSPPVTREEWAESTSAPSPSLEDNQGVFESLFERSADAIWLYEVYDQTVLLVDCNQAAVELIGAKSKKEVLHMRPEDLSPPLQPDGLPSARKTIEVVATVQRQKAYRFEWMIRRLDGTEVPIEVSATVVRMNGKDMHVAISRDISERKKAEHELRELTHALERRVSERTAALTASEAKFRALFEGSSQGVVLHDERQILEVNPAAVRIMGRQLPHELIGKHPREMAPPFQPNGETSDAIAARYIDECTSKGSARFDWVARTAAGEDIFLEVALTRIEWSGRQVIQAFITDITERQRTQTALAESEARFSAAFNSSPVITGVTCASDGKFVLVNDASLNWSGYSRDEALGRTAIELGVWEDPAERDRWLNDIRSSGSVRERECRWRNRHGSVSTMLASGALIEINGVDHLLVMAVDISERKRAEAELRASEARLRESEARFSAAFQASPALIGILRISDGKYVLANDAHLNWLGYPREELLGRTCLELGMWENSGERDSLLKDMHTFGSIRQRECRWRNRRGERFTILLSAETIQLNNAPHMLLIALDITQRKRAEEELHKTLAREKELSQLKSNFVSMVSHEFRTPLGIIQSSAELLRDFHGKMQSGERQDQLDSISRNSRRMAAMMEEVLVLSRLDAGKLIFQPAALDLNTFCRRVVDEVRSATNRRCFIDL